MFLINVLIEKSFIDINQDKSYEINVTEIFQALSDPISLDIVLCLLDKKRGCLLKERYPVVTSILFHHLKILREAEIIILYKNGHQYKYEVNKEYLNENFPGLLQQLENQITKGTTPIDS